jgi:CRISPR/Cas system-associated exonuclease Cas4 (RecB family)
MIELPAHSSYSQLNGYTTCGARYWIERMVGVKGEPSWALVGGSAIHEMTADYDTSHTAPEVAWWSSALFDDYFSNELEKTLVRHECTEAGLKATGRASKEWPNKRDKAWWLANGPVIFERWASWSQACPWEILDIGTLAEGVEPEHLKAVEFEVSGYIGETFVKAYVDRAYVLPSGEVAVVDLKTGTMKPADNLQLGIYAVLMEKTLGVRPSYGYYWMGESGGTTEPADLSRYTEDYLASLFTQQLRGIENGVFLPSVSSMCSGCSVRAFCRAVGGARADEIPDPRPVTARVTTTAEGN